MSTLKFNKWQSIDGVTRNAVLQFVAKDVTTQTSQTTAAWTTATDMDISITPTSATSKIYVMYNVGFRIGSSTTSAIIAIRLLRNSSVIYAPHVNNGTGNYAYGMSVGGSSSTLVRGLVPIHYLDSPSTTNQVTYSIQFSNYLGTSSYIGYINESGKSSIALMEIAQ